MLTRGTTSCCRAIHQPKSATDQCINNVSETTPSIARKANEKAHPSHTMRFVHVPQTAFIASTLATPPNTSSSFFSETATTSSVRDSLRIEPALDSSSARGSAGENSCAATASMPLAGLSWEDMVFSTSGGRERRGGLNPQWESIRTTRVVPRFLLRRVDPGPRPRKELLRDTKKAETDGRVGEVTLSNVGIVVRNVPEIASPAKGGTAGLLVLSAIPRVHHWNFAPPPVCRAPRYEGLEAR